MFTKITAAALLIMLLSSPAFSQNYVVNVHGIVCEFCTYGVAKNVRKLDFIDKTQFEDGVKVDIDNQMVYVAVRKDAALKQDVLFEAIESGGYKPVKIWSINDAGEKTELK